ncbi:MAG: Cys-tRNA(Pro) deacylase [Oscillospiraceae bacterium]|jgi:Cys-tRNA(Pro)/Cys-tRNA(Cys) deacylase|nr:Cys-tRNA(Pro) deacylase [Oscillospiraceae bacterium]MCI1989783.1 Cys-tRNA(Pro) deacylase [Oscillospiraceae bacterium]MCI2034386.1 Cys-tRNA(Pro) deacylase [Oscillospiraceae bacterium]
MAKELKTNVMRILEQAKIPYKAWFYDNKDGKIDGVSVARKLGENVDQVFKTLVTRGADKNYYVFAVPVAMELNRKAAAKSVGVKSVEMIHVSEINRVTGYIRGGCSPVGMKKQFRTVIDRRCEALDTILVSGGRIGTQVEVNPKRLLDLIGGTTAEIAEQAD